MCTNSDFPSNENVSWLPIPDGYHDDDHDDDDELMMMIVVMVVLNVINARMALPVAMMMLMTTMTMAMTMQAFGDRWHGTLLGECPEAIE